MGQPDRSQPAGLGYRPALDGLRALAIGLVVVHHTGAFLAPAHRGALAPGGFLGVDVFLVLSGFLITTLLLERREREPRPLLTFYARRALRLLPAVAVLLAANLALALARDRGTGDALRAAAAGMSYLTNWAELAGISISHYVTPLWSLAIEEQFYLVWPPVLLALLARRSSRRMLLGVSLGVVVVVAAWRLALYDSGDPWLRIYLRTDARADALAVGVALALAPWDRWTARLDARRLALAGAAGLALVVAAAELLDPSAPVLYRGGFTAVAGAVAVLILALLAPGGPLARAFAWGPAVWLGRLSYSLYLWHFGLFQLIAEHTGRWAAGPRAAAGWAAALLAAELSRRLVERPALRLKNRLGGPAREPAATVSVPPG